MLISTYQNFIFKIAFIASIFYFVKVKSTEKCNQNQILDELTNKCIDCPAGFYGPRCNVTCPFPNFGQDCLSICTCIKDQCNYIYGCKIGFQTTPPNSSTTKTKNDFKSRTRVLISVAGTFISSLLVVALGFQLRSRLFCRKGQNHQQQMVCEEENIYAEIRK
ncbi:uncharacterized protein LOC111110892 isoform X2 [Crassostrea virginica]